MQVLQSSVQSAIEDLPRIGQVSQVSISQEAYAVFTEAETYMKSMGDSYITEEHLLL